MRVFKNWNIKNDDKSKANITNWEQLYNCHTAQVCGEAMAISKTETTTGEKEDDKLI